MNQDAITELYHAYMRPDQYNPYDYVPFYYEHGGIQIGSAAEDPTKKIRSLHDPDQVFSGLKICMHGKSIALVEIAIQILGSA